MQLLPGLGRIKVRRIKDAFEKPFYPHAIGKDTSETMPSVGVHSGINQPKEAARTDIAQPKSREPSPVWDIELDLNPSDIDAEEPQDRPQERERSPVWDIELDLNPSEISSGEDEGPPKRRRK